MMIFHIPDDEEPMWVLAKDMGDAIAKWRKWVAQQSDGAISELTMVAEYPRSITEVADDKEIIK